MTQIIVSFSGAVNAGEADSLATYRLATAGKKGSFTAKNAQVIKLKSALYNAATNTVTLTPKKAFSLTKPVQLVVDGEPPSGLRDSYGRFIDGDHNGTAGGNAIAIIAKKGVTVDAKVSARVEAKEPHSRTAVIDALLSRGELAGSKHALRDRNEGHHLES